MKYHMWSVVEPWTWDFHGRVLTALFSGAIVSTDKNGTCEFDTHVWHTVAFEQMVRAAPIRSWTTKWNWKFFFTHSIDLFQKQWMRNDTQKHNLSLYLLNSAFPHAYLDA